MNSSAIGQLVCCVSTTSQYVPGANLMWDLPDAVVLVAIAVPSGPKTGVSLNRRHDPVVGTTMPDGPANAWLRPSIRSPATTTARSGAIQR